MKQKKVFVEELGRAAASGEGRGLEFYKDYTPEQVKQMVAASPEAQAYKEKNKITRKTRNSSCNCSTNRS